MVKRLYNPLPGHYGDRRAGAVLQILAARRTGPSCSFTRSRSRGEILTKDVLRLSKPFSRHKFRLNLKTTVNITRAYSTTEIKKNFKEFKK